MSEIVVFGSLNADLVLKVPTLPTAGQTVLGGSVRTHEGGKGANQAVAAARAAGSLPTAVTVRMVGRVGRDDYGQRLRTDLAASGVEIDGVVVDPTEPTGMALILVDDAGENLIAVAPGANGAVDHTDAERAVSGLGPSDVVVCQLEVPLPAVRALARATRVAGARLVCNAAPAVQLDTLLLQGIDVLVLNETEAQVVLGGGVREPAAAAAAAAGAGCAIVVTLGAQGAVYAEPDGASGSCPAPVVEVVDTVGAGDAFVGALAVRLVTGASLAEAVTAGVAAGSRAVVRAGARFDPPGPPHLLAAPAERDGV
jgi:ribokinase